MGWTGDKGGEERGKNKKKKEEALDLTIVTHVCTSQEDKEDQESRTYASTSSRVGYGPMPRMPFSLCSHTLRPLGKKLGASVGMPTPRLT